MFFVYYTDAVSKFNLVCLFTTHYLQLNLSKSTPHSDEARPQQRFSHSLGSQAAESSGILGPRAILFAWVREKTSSSYHRHRRTLAVWELKWKR